MSVNAVTGLSITNPLVKYRALVATKQVLPDQSQLRLALHLQKLYERLKDYEPRIEYSARLDQISRAINNGYEDSNTASAPPRQSSWRNLLAAKERRDSLALTRKLTSHESALELTSPKGLMLHGEVGTGKSMLVDLFADCLPNQKKRRWHFNTFMLETFAKLEALRRSRIDSSQAIVPGVEDDYSLLWLAKDMIQTSPILFLDEFQMPDRVASKILTNLMTSFFHLGGVLIATSNRMPEELAKASGIEFTPPPSRMESLGWQFGRGQKSNSDKLFGGQNEFVAFLDVLKARCDVWEMEGGKDYRRLDNAKASPPPTTDKGDEWRLDGHDDMQHSVGMAGWPSKGTEEQANTAEEEEVELPKLPTFFNTGSTAEEDTLPAALLQSTGEILQAATVPWSSTIMTVYGRTIPVPHTYSGITMWTFADLCMSTLGPADYITLASTYHTLILTDVPVLTWHMKNEARRFITLLDALYECKCKLYIRAASGPDDLFFPEKSDKSANESEDAVYSETISEVYQDATAPFRPNILSQNPNYAEPDAEPDYTHARLAGLLNADALEDDPPNKPRRSAFGRSFGRTDAEMERKPVDPDEVRYTQRRGPDFGKTSAFTGEDERFAYKRAQSRLWEMCGAKWWARSEEGWHRPLPVEVRRWERGVEERTAAERHRVSAGGPGPMASDVSMGPSEVDETRDERSFRMQSASPFRTETEPPPKISWTHFWGTTIWGKKAGAWGQGPEGLKDRGNQKR